MSNRRPQTSGARAEAEMKDKAARAMANAKDPVEKLRLFALSRGAKGIMGLGRYLKLSMRRSTDFHSTAPFIMSTYEF